MIAVVDNVGLRRPEIHRGGGGYPGALAGGRPIEIEVDGGISVLGSPRPAPMCWSPAAPCSGSAKPRAAAAEAYGRNIEAIRNAAAMARGEAA